MKIRSGFTVVAGMFFISCGTHSSKGQLGVGVGNGGVMSWTGECGVVSMTVPGGTYDSHTEIPLSDEMKSFELTDKASFYGTQGEFVTSVGIFHWPEKHESFLSWAASLEGASPIEIDEIPGVVYPSHGLLHYLFLSNCAHSTDLRLVNFAAPYTVDLGDFADFWSIIPNGTSSYVE